MRNEAIAHISEDGNRIQTVAEHLRGTADLAREFASAFGAGEQGELVGLLHDIGKYSAAFQRRIQCDGPRVDHSTAGAQEAIRMQQIPAAFAIAGHHGGLPDGGHPQDTADEATLLGRLRKAVEPCDTWQQEITLQAVSIPEWTMQDNITSAFYTRMLYSCLVDADYLDTETFMDGQEAPRGGGSTINELLCIVRARAAQYLQTYVASPVIQLRNAVLQAAIERGRTGEQGLYTLTVPTGGGKTFASLAYALEQAAAHGMERVIYVIPYMSIIDQTAQTFADLLGDENVLAHYSAAGYQTKDCEDLTPMEYRHLLATENWDAPVIVTTAVQFYESLYSNRSSHCRKLHNIANSVVILDEAQTLPSDYLYPCIAAITQLVQHYHVTAVLCTATQPALGPILQELAPELTMTEISPDPDLLYETLRRVTFCDAGTLAKQDLQETLSEMPQVLCIVNRRKTAQELYEALPAEGSYCLTTLLCAADRRDQFVEIRERLRRGQTCRVISTSLIEAGVDVDFPIVFREECGLDSLLQAAGRCNREGNRSAEDSTVYRFCLQDYPAPQALHSGIGALHYTLRHHERLNTPDAIHCYFHELFYKIRGREALDRKGILPAFMNGISGCMFPFAQVADRFRIIETPTRNVYLPMGEGAELCERLRMGLGGRSLYRRLGVYSISCYAQQFDALDAAGALEILDGGDAILMDMQYYDSHTGLDLEPQSGIGIMI